MIPQNSHSYEEHDEKGITRFFLVPCAQRNPLVSDSPGQLTKNLLTLFSCSWMFPHLYQRNSKNMWWSPVVHHPSNQDFPKRFHPWHKYVFSTLRKDHRSCAEKNAGKKPKLEGRLPKISWHSLISVPTCFFLMCFRLFPCHVVATVSWYCFWTSQPPCSLVADPKTVRPASYTSPET